MTAAQRHIVVVGAGYMGRMSIALIATALPEATFHVIDRDPAALAAVADTLADRATTVQADFLADGLPPLPAAADVVVNFAGPFYAGANTVATAALAAAIPYVDICDDAEGTRAVLDLDAQARATGIALVTGAGNSPGMSNVFAHALLQRHNDLDGIRVVWVVREDDPGGLAPLRHMLHMAVVPCPIWDDGAATTSVGFSPKTARTHQLPEPVGQVTAFDTSHPEPITLPRAFPQLRHASCQGALLPQWSNDAFSMLGKLGFGDPSLRVQVDGHNLDPTEVLWKVLWARHTARPELTRRCLTIVQVQGLRGDDITATATIVDDHAMVRTTGIGAATAVVSLLQTPAPPGAWGTEILHPTPTLAIFARIAASACAIREGVQFADTLAQRR
jgi:saccharopine dehydrogenase-like NADP-dependent oxidoreductase